ncbi:uncharacterized protein K02A2.6 [Nephila pilipes]|uniref:RNA-directed DNA polymerase n=1 Tax=Nephila pilipes TaxID=299642 RepID=A0A8X6ND64_NEPPI|nr:uncharacterized protein K02A2.6 [Nephila pilipes]
MNVPENELDVYLDSVTLNETKCDMISFTIDKNVEMVSETWYKSITLDVNHKCFDVNFKLDTGAEVNILPLYILNMFKVKPKLSETNLSFTTYEKEGIVSKVNKPTDWVQSLVIVEKPNGNQRLCLDPRDLNKVIKREHYQIPCTDDIISRLEGKKIFFVVDLKDGFWHVPLDEVSSESCTFNTPFGRYKFNKLPFGIVYAPEVFQKRNQKFFGDIEDVEIYFDDIIVAGYDEDSHDAIMSKVLERARSINIKFNPDKLQYRVSEVKHVGQIISKSGIKPDPDHIKAVVAMPTPKSKTEVRRLLGMEGLLFSNEKLTVPYSLRKDMLKLIHEAHFGIEKCKKRAREIMYWPGMNSDIETVVSECVICEKFKKANSEKPLKLHTVPYRPFEKMGVDIMDFGNISYLVVIDYYSKWIEIAELANKCADEVLIKLKTVFSRFGVPNTVISDNILFNSYIFKNFSNEWDFNYAFISPHYSPSNGMVERAVGIAKSIMRKAKEDKRDYLVGLMEYRNTPISGLDLSPAQMMFNRRLKTKLPISNKLLNAELFNNIREKLIERQNI